jgi:hypothetical protein
MSPDVSAASPVFDVNQLKGWLPVDAVVKNGRPGLEWLDMNGVELSEPLLYQTVARVRREQPEQRERFTEFETLIQFEKISTGLSPTGFIFHSSRCGSTLVANACKALNNALVISEAYAIDKLIGRFFTDLNEDRTRELLYSILVRGAVNALGQPRSGRESRYFVKFSCFSVLQLARIRRIWPDVPWIFVYRDPVEVVVSNLENPPEWMNVEENRTMAAALLGTSEDEIHRLSREEFCARAVGRFYEAVHGLVDNTRQLINYEEFSLDALLATARFFGITTTAAESEAIGRVLSVYAKDVSLQRPFLADSEAKQAAASNQVREMADRWALAPYLLLEKKRKPQSPTT